jgi:hypothetical protein
MRAYACLLANGATIALGMAHRYCCGSIGRIALAGTTVAYTEAVIAVDSGCTSIVVLDVARRRTLVSLPQVACSIDAGFIKLGQVTDLAVSPHGAVAWILATGSGGRVTSLEVHRAEPAGGSVLLDQGPGIAPASLRVSGGTLYWQDDGHRRTAPLA